MKTADELAAENFTLQQLINEKLPVYVQELARVRAELEALKASIEPGSLESNVAAVFDLAKDFGASDFSSEPPTAYLRELLARLRAEVAAKNKFVTDAIAACSETGKELTRLREILAEMVEAHDDECPSGANCKSAYVIEARAAILPHDVEEEGPDNVIPHPSNVHLM